MQKKQALVQHKWDFVAQKEARNLSELMERWFVSSRCVTAVFRGPCKSYQVSKFGHKLTRLLNIRRRDTNNFGMTVYEKCIKVRFEIHLSNLLQQKFKKKMHHL